MVAVALPTKRVIERLFELSNIPCGFECALRSVLGLTLSPHFSLSAYPGWAGKLPRCCRKH